jgi:hypothetical protein
LNQVPKHSADFSLLAISGETLANFSKFLSKKVSQEEETKILCWRHRLSLTIYVFGTLELSAIRMQLRRDSLAHEIAKVLSQKYRFLLKIGRSLKPQLLLTWTGDAPEDAASEEESEDVRGEKREAGEDEFLKPEEGGAEASGDRFGMNW